MQLKGTLIKILYSNDEGFFIGLLDSGEKIKGTYLATNITHLKQSSVVLEGEWVEHKEYGKSFAFTTLKLNHNELFFFLTKVLKGFTKETAHELIEFYSQEKLIDILDNNIEKLLEFKGIKEKRLKKIQTSWKKFRSMRELGEFLSPYDITPALLVSIATAFKEVDKACKKIKQNPYILTSIKGIGFKTADELALKMGIQKEDTNRINSAISFVLLEYCESQGNSCVAKEQLYALLDELLHFENKTELYEDVIATMMDSGELILLQNNLLSPERLYRAEEFLYEFFLKKTKERESQIVEDIEEFLTKHNFNLGDEQKEALLSINNGAKLLFLVGYAGTGKSTTAQSILTLLNTRYATKEIMTSALSGIASQRIAERTGYESATLQSLLVKYKESEEFPFEVLLIDEASMINAPLFARVLTKVKNSATVIVVGDDAQLPPIGSGNVLSDMLMLGFAPILKLTTIYRQGENQAITTIANDIRKAMVPEYRAKYEDFVFYDHSIPNYYMLKNTLTKEQLHSAREQNHSNIIATMLELLLKHLSKARYRLQNKQLKEYLNYFQVITPIKGGTLGVHNLNAVLQEYFNPNPKVCIQQQEKEFRLMDKVVHLKNDNLPSWSLEEFKDGGNSSKRRIFNGMCGLLFKIDKEDELAYVVYPSEDVVVMYSFDELRIYLELSYALTIHKVQGMEYDIVVMPISFSHYIMLNTKLLYTAITRAKHLCYIVGEAAAFESGCKRFDTTKRETVLLELGNKQQMISS